MAGGISYLTYSLELLQTRGAKGRALRTAMQLWTTAVGKFLEMAADSCDELDAIMALPRAESRKKLDHWVYDRVYHDPRLAGETGLMEATVKFALYRTLHSQLKSYFALKADGYEPGFPTGRIVTEGDFPALLDEFAGEGHVATVEGDYVTLAGLVSGFGRKSEYLPLDFYYYKPYKGFFIAKSASGNYFAGLYIEPGNSGFEPAADDLVIVGTGESVVARKKPCRLFPIAMNKRLQRKLETYKPATARVVERGGRFFLHVSLEVADREIPEPRAIIGVDLGKRRIAAASLLTMDGQWLESASVDGLHVRQIKEIEAKVRKAQARGSQYRFRYKPINKQIVHITANKIIELARQHSAVVVIEELSGLRRANVAPGKRPSNYGRRSNTYALFREAMLYKCKAAGVLVDEVGPAYTSQTCPKCGHIDAKNRLVPVGDKVTRFRFRCVSCGFEHGSSDEVAAVNIGRRYLYKKECIETKRKSKSATNRSWGDFVQQMCAG